MHKKIEIWGGIECTVNRVREEYFDQMERSGHYIRNEDLDLIAEMGIKTLRYAVIWEKVAPYGLKFADWRWTDQRLEQLRELGIEPIVGLLHHGSGPRYTNLIDNEFSDKFADFAAAVAERYPWVTKYTPINEPLTTARFSGLYGHWYPHGRDDSTFTKAVLNQCRGTVKAMQEIRLRNPQAELIQTEDVGKTYCTPQLQYQAEFDNERRWAALDLICGKLTHDTAMFKYFLDNGARLEELEWFMENKTPPNIIGVNHYITSERFLDHRTDKYPTWTRGGNGRHNYADVEAVRVCKNIGNIELILSEVWDRYRLPIAITEAHLGADLEEQQKWLWERWLTANQLLEEGIDIRAVTVWALFGSFDWHKLCTRKENHYEPGVFDIRTDPPTATGLEKLVRHLTAAEEFDLSLLERPGWWQRDDRIHYPMVTVPIGIGGAFCVCDVSDVEELSSDPQLRY